jgi:hypothetical protein
MLQQLSFFCVLLTRAQNGSHRASQSQKVTSSEADPKRDLHPADDFAGLTYSDEQKAEIDKIHQDTQGVRMR